MRKLRTFTPAVLALWIMISTFYYSAFKLVSKNNFNLKISKEKYSSLNISNGVYNETEDYLINTPGCYIHNYGKNMVFNEAKYNTHSSCNTRAIFLEKISNEKIIFRIDERQMSVYTKGKKHYKCCFQYVSRPSATILGIKDTRIIYSPCVLFQNGTTTKLKQEVISVTCGTDPIKKIKTIYEDVYMLVKKKEIVKNQYSKEKSWNVLILGMDTMSRARAYKNMPLTMQYFKQHGWLDYRGYQKVGFNTFPNLMSILSGNVYIKCKQNMDDCNPHLMWTKYRDEGYATAYGEDFLSLPDTFKNYGGFEEPPTDHYMRPLFLTGESITGNIVCTKKMPSAIHILDYAYHIAQTYKDDRFFTMFWINSYSHNEYNLPALIDKYTAQFFEKLQKSETLNNTFIMFLSDHGIRYGKMRYQAESFYEERLPMFFMWVPEEFKMQHPIKHHSLEVNQNRLTTPYDLHATLWEILKMSRPSVNVLKPQGCPNCTSLFEEKSVYRTCADAAVDEKWCSCHKMVPVNQKEADAMQTLQIAVSSIQNRTKDVKTIECTKCSELKLKTLLRTHSYKNDITNKTFYIVAFLMSPGDVGFELTIEKTGVNYTVIQPLSTITGYNKLGKCVEKKLRDQPYCVCENILVPRCHKKHKS